MADQPAIAGGSGRHTASLTGAAGALGRAGARRRAESPSPLAALAYGRQAAQQAYDRLLIGAADQIAGSVSVQGGRVLVDIPASAFELLALAPDDRLLYAVLDPDGAPRHRLRRRGGDPRRRFATGDFAGEPVRLIRVSRQFAERDFAGTVDVVVGQTTRARDALAREITRSALARRRASSGSLMAALAAFAIRSALAPLRRIEGGLAAREPRDLTPLDVAVPREIGALVGAINRFMARQARQFEIMRNLIADASHQLRTPVAAMRAQAELAADETDPERQRAIVARIHDRAVGLSRLTDQLLNHALIIHRADAAPHETVDLRTIAIRIVEETDAGADDLRARPARGPGRLPRRCAVAGRGRQEPRQQRLPPRRPAGDARRAPRGGERGARRRDRGPGMPEALWDGAGARFDRTGAVTPQSASIGLSIVAAVAPRTAGRCASGAARPATSRRPSCCPSGRGPDSVRFLTASRAILGRCRQRRCRRRPICTQGRKNSMSIDQTARRLAPSRHARRGDLRSPRHGRPCRARRRRDHRPRRSRRRLRPAGRAVQATLQESGLASSVQVINVPGAGGTIGLAQFVNGRSRGSPLIVAGLGMVGAIDVNKSPVSLDQATPLARMTGEYQPLVVGADSPIKTLDDLAAMYKADPGSVTWGGFALGSPDHLVSAMTVKAFGGDVKQMNYIVAGAGGEMLSQVLGGHITVATGGYNEFAGLIETGELRALAISSPERLPGVDIPTFKELGYDVELVNWRGLLTKADLGDEDRAALDATIGEMVKSEAWQTPFERAWLGRHVPELGDLRRIPRRGADARSVTSSSSSVSPSKSRRGGRPCGRPPSAGIPCRDEPPQGSPHAICSRLAPGAATRPPRPCAGIPGAHGCAARRGVRDLRSRKRRRAPPRARRHRHRRARPRGPCLRRDAAGHPDHRRIVGTPTSSTRPPPPHAW